MSEINDLILSVEQATKSERRSMLDQAHKFEDVVEEFESAIVAARHNISGDDGFDSDFFTRNTGKVFIELQRCNHVVFQAQATLDDLSGISELLEKVVSAPKEAAKEILNRLTTFLATIPEQTKAVTAAGEQGLDCWFSLFTPAEKAKARASMEAVAHTHTKPKPMTILTQEVSHNEYPATPTVG